MLYINDTTSKQHTGSLTLQIFLFALPSCSQNLQYKICVVGISFETEHSTVSCPLHFTSCVFILGNIGFIKEFGDVPSFFILWHNLRHMTVGSLLKNW